MKNEAALRAILPDLVEPLLELVRHCRDIPNPEPRTSLANLEFLLERILNDPALPLDKTQRWLGFVQGVLACRGFWPADEERDRTRPIFHAYYLECGVAPPESISLDENTK